MSLANFKLARRNPNEGVGGSGCLCKAQGKAIGCDGPFIVFDKTDTIEPGSPHAVLGAECARAVVKALDETDPVEYIDIGTDMYDVTERIAEQPKADTDWEDLPVEEQNALQEQLPQGGLIHSQYGLVVVPQTGETPAEVVEPAVEISYWPQDVNVQDGELPLEEPGDKPGEYVTVEEDDDEVPQI